MITRINDIINNYFNLLIQKALWALSTKVVTASHAHSIPHYNFTSVLKIIISKDKQQIKTEDFFFVRKYHQKKQKNIK